MGEQLGVGQNQMGQGTVREHGEGAYEGEKPVVAAAAVGDGVDGKDGVDGGGIAVVNGDGKATVEVKDVGVEKEDHAFAEEMAGAVDEIQTVAAAGCWLLAVAAVEQRP